MGSGFHQIPPMEPGEILSRCLAAQVQLGQPEHNASLESFLSRKLGVLLCTSWEGGSASVIILLKNMYVCMYIYIYT